MLFDGSDKTDYSIADLIVGGDTSDMKVGVAIFFTDYSATPVELAKELEDRGFDSLWAPEHSHIPTSRISEFPQGGELPNKYYDVMDPFTTLPAAAAVTQKLLIATGICLVVQRDPIQTAKSVASLDHISSGRFLFGVGAGWNAEEMADHGTDFKTRMSLMKERLAAMREIWTSSRPSYSGDLVKFPEMITNPKPLQKPYPAVLVGGAFPHGAKRAIEYGDGWLPHAKRPAYGDVLHKFSEFRSMAVDLGRDPDTIPITVYGVPDDVELLKRYRDAGTKRVVFSLPSVSLDELSPLLDRYSCFIESLK